MHTNVGNIKNLGTDVRVAEGREDALRGTPETLVALSSSFRLTGSAAPALEAYVAERLSRCANAILGTRSGAEGSAAPLDKTGSSSNGNAPTEDSSGNSTTSFGGGTNTTTTFPGEVGTEADGPSADAPLLLVVGLVSGVVAALVSPLVLLLCACGSWRLRLWALKRRRGGEVDLEMGRGEPRVEEPGEEEVGGSLRGGRMAIART